MKKTLKEAVDASRKLSGFAPGKKLIRENSFDGAGGGSNGTLNYQSPLNTPSTPISTATYGKENHYSVTNVAPTHNTDLNDLYEKVRKLYADAEGTDWPDLDQIIAGLSFEMGQTIKVDKTRAFEKVIDNLSRNSHYYSDLDQLNINDDGACDEYDEAKEREVVSPKRWSVDLTKPAYELANNGGLNKPTEDQKAYTKNMLDDMVKNKRKKHI
jgi:hypothetical protein